MYRLWVAEPLAVGSHKLGLRGGVHKGLDWVDSGAAAGGEALGGAGQPRQH